MKKKNTIISFIKDNWYFVLFFIPFIFCCFENKAPNNDIWFLMNNGRYVLSNGFPHFDPFTIHKGLHFIMQQWLSSVIFYGVFSIFGKYGLLSIVLVLFLILIIVLYKLCYLLSKDKVRTIIIMTVALSIAKDFMVTRPQLITFIVLLIETFCLEKYYRDNK